MAEVTETLTRALESECARDMCEVIAKRASSDFAQLREVVANDKAPAQERIKAIYALGRWGDTKAVADIAKAMPKLDELGTITAIDALGRLGSPAALKAVLRHTKAPSPELRKFVIRALGRFTGAEAQRTLQEMHKAEQVPHLRNLALKYVERTGRSK